MILLLIFSQMIAIVLYPLCRFSMFLRRVFQVIGIVHRIGTLAIIHYGCNFKVASVVTIPDLRRI